MPKKCLNTHCRNDAHEDAKHCSLCVDGISAKEELSQLRTENKAQAEEIVELKETNKRLRTELLESKGLSLSLLITKEKAVGLLKKYKYLIIQSGGDGDVDKFLSKQEKPDFDKIKEYAESDEGKESLVKDLEIARKVASDWNKASKVDSRILDEPMDI